MKTAIKFIPLILFFSLAFTSQAQIKNQNWASPSGESVIDIGIKIGLADKELLPLYDTDIKRPDHMTGLVTYIVIRTYQNECVAIFREEVVCRVWDPSIQTMLKGHRYAVVKGKEVKK